METTTSDQSKIRKVNPKLEQLMKEIGNPNLILYLNSDGDNE